MDVDLDDLNFSSAAEAKAFAHNYTENYNRSLNTDLHDLTPEQMHKMLYKPFDSPDIVTFSDCIDTEPPNKITAIFKLLIEAIGSDGLEANAEGNLPQDIVRKIVNEYYADEDGPMFDTECFRAECDFDLLYLIRQIAECAGLICKQENKFMLTDKCKEIMEEKGLSAIYPIMLCAYIKDYKWLNGDKDDDFAFIQKSALFTLYMLYRYGDKARFKDFYEDAFIKAFPSAVLNIPEIPFEELESLTRDVYTLFMLKFLVVTELIEFEEVEDGPRKIRKTPLFDQAMVFNI